MDSFGVLVSMWTNGVSELEKYEKVIETMVFNLEPLDKEEVESIRTICEDLGLNAEGFYDLYCR